MVIAVTGATGFLGQALLDLALDQGFAVRALTRKPQPDRPGVTWVRGDLANREALAELCTGTEALIHVAGLVNTADPANFAQANVDGTANVIDVAQSNPSNRRSGPDPESRFYSERPVDLTSNGRGMAPHASIAPPEDSGTPGQARGDGSLGSPRTVSRPRLIFVSSLSAREPTLSAYGASKAQAEALVTASNLDWTIVRPPTVYGPRDIDMFELFRAARWGVVPVPGKGRSSIIHAKDLSALLLALIPTGEQVTHRTFEPDDGKPNGWDHRELALAIGQAVGRRPFVLPLSARAMRWAAYADTRLRGAKAKLTLDRVGYMTHPDWVVNPAAQVPPDLWQSRIPTSIGLKTTAQWYRQYGWL